MWNTPIVGQVRRTIGGSSTQQVVLTPWLSEHHLSLGQLLRNSHQRRSQLLFGQRLNQGG